MTYPASLAELWPSRAIWVVRGAIMAREFEARSNYIYWFQLILGDLQNDSRISSEYIDLGLMTLREAGIDEEHIATLSLGSIEIPTDKEEEVSEKIKTGLVDPVLVMTAIPKMRIFVNTAEIEIIES